MKKQRMLSLCLASLLLLALAACKEPTQEQNSPQPTPTAAPTPTPPPIPYTDVAEDAPYYDAVVWAFENGIASDGETFGPADPCTRAQAVTFLWRAMGQPAPKAAENPFSDVDSDDWYYEPALWASENGIATGTEFKSGSPCTNAEALTFLWRAEGEPMAAVYSSPTALAAPGKYYARPVAWAEAGGLLSGAGFDHSAPCSRADLMTYLYRAQELRASAEGDRALQAEYEQILSSSPRYEVHGSGLLYADYVDVDSDGKLELLTVGIDLEDNKFTAAIYADVDGHAKKTGEGSFEAFVAKMSALSLCKADGGLYLRSSGFNNYGWGHDSSDEYLKLERGAVTAGDKLFMEEAYQDKTDTVEYTYTVSGKEATEGEHQAVLNKYGDETLLYNLDFGHLSISGRGLLSAPKIEVNGSAVELSAQPYITPYDHVFVVPLRDVLEGMGVAVYINSDSTVIVASTKSDTLVVSKKSLYLGIDGDSWDYDNYQYSMNYSYGQEAAVETDNNGTIFMPFQTLMSLFGAKAEWNGAAEAIQITFDLPDSSRMTQDELNRMINFTSEEAIKIGERNGHSFWGMMVAYIEGGFYFSNGKAVWEYAALPAGQDAVYDYDPNDGGHHEGTPPSNMYYVQVAHDGTITTSKYPHNI